MPKSNKPNRTKDSGKLYTNVCKTCNEVFISIVKNGDICGSCTTRKIMRMYFNEVFDRLNKKK